MTLCIEYQGKRDRDGYGHFGNWRKHKSVVVIRQIMAAIHGWEAIEGMMVLHSCDNPSCVNIAHLRIGTAKENRADADDRRRTAVGVRHHAVKLNEYAIRWIRSLHATGDYTQKELGEMFGTRANNISLIVNRQSWRHLS